MIRIKKKKNDATFLTGQWFRSVEKEKMYYLIKPEGRSETSKNLWDDADILKGMIF